MISLADLWGRPGQNVGRSYPASIEQRSIEEIVTELKAWVQRRKTNNDSKEAAGWDMLCTLKSLQQSANRPGAVQAGQEGTVMDPIAEYLARQKANLGRTRVS